MPPFRSLSARLTVQFALLFAAAMLVVSTALSSLISGSASREVAGQLQSSGAVYDRLWNERAHELQGAAQLLARDFGFRAAVATGDQATIQSALGNAAARLKVRSAFIVTADGRSMTIDPSIQPKEAEALWAALDEGRLSGVSVLAGRPRQLVAAPIMAPTLIGWVVFAADLDTREMRGLERLSAIPLHAAVLAYGDGRWTEATGSMSATARRSRWTSAARPRSRWPSSFRHSPTAIARSSCSLIRGRRRCPTRTRSNGRLPP